MVVEISLTNIPKMGNVLVVPLGISHGLRLEPLVDIAQSYRAFISEYLSRYLRIRILLCCGYG